MTRRFVFVAWALSPGGTLSVMRSLWPPLERHGSSSVLARGPNRALANVPVLPIPGRGHPLRFPGIWLYFARTFRAALRAARESPDTVLLPQDSLATGAAVALAGRLARRPVVVMEHGTASAVRSDYFWMTRFPPRGRLGWLRHRLLRWSVLLLHRTCVGAATLVLIAGDEEEAAWRRLGYPPARIVRYHFGVDLERFHPAGQAERAAVRGSMGLAGSGPLVVSVGRLAPEKGLDDLIAAVAEADEARTATLVLAGDGPMRVSLEQAAHRAGLDVRFPGALSVDDVAQLLRAADLFVYNGIQGANTPYAVLEAMASGLPVVATTAPAIHAAMLADGRGHAVAPGDREALGRAVASLLRDEALRASMGMAARSYVEANHGPQTLEDELAGLMVRLDAVTRPRN